MSSPPDGAARSSEGAAALPTSTLLSAVALLLAAVALSLSLAGPDAPPAEPGPQTSSSSASTDSSEAPTRAELADDGLSRRVARLEAEVVMLRRALQLEAGAAVRPSAPPARTGGTAPVLDDETAAAIADAIETAPEVTAKIERLVDEKMQARRDERWARRAERLAERDAKMIESVREQHDLEDDEASKIGALLGAEREQVFALFREARDNGRWQEAREKIEAIVQGTDSNVAAVLDEEAFATWSTLRDERASRWRRGGRRGGGERGDRGGDGERR